MSVLVRLGVAALFAAHIASAYAAAAEPLSFTVEGDSYVVPRDDLVSVETHETGGLTFCLAPGAEKALTDFTARHPDETVSIAIGDTNVFYLKIVKPYGGGCINWPLHPKVAQNYRNMLLGEVTAQ
ncbi:hypothetical protein [Acuticoccus sediminis]|uniref:hypothetical protein n=1 Tax=Acuticoccus sediminis TaxID=2184697 RepID=UPI001CFEC54D|nr:hypothetical protein [Acuticoccus sediminis]